MEDSTAYDLILDTLIILRRLLKGTEENYHFYRSSSSKIHDIITKALSHDYSKVVSESLRVAGIFVYVLRDPSGNIDADFTSLI